MNKRLRKKKRVKEFQELGIEVSCAVDLGSSSMEFEIWCDDFIIMIESLNLICGGGGQSKNWSIYVCRNRGSVSEEDKLSIFNWLTNNKHVKYFNIGEFSDVWH